MCGRQGNDAHPRLSLLGIVDRILAPAARPSQSPTARRPERPGQETALRSAGKRSNSRRSNDLAEMSDERNELAEGVVERDRRDAHDVGRTKIGDDARTRRASAMRMASGWTRAVWPPRRSSSRGVPIEKP